ncbi:MAG: c-type cytochrome [Woeseiaceae bacterium]|nr:c-type cytochrome [Woeseiaceae bacterium]
MKIIASQSGRFLYAILAVPVLVALGFLAVFVLSERELRSVQLPPPFEMPPVVDKATVERGRHLARTRGCLGCHGQQLQGVDFSEEWLGMGTTIAPNLALFAKQYEPAVLEAAIRHGIGHDGKALWSMPSYNFKHLTDKDTVALIAFLQSAPVIEQNLPKPRFSWSLRWTIATGAEPHMVDLVAEVPALRLSEGDDPQLARGEYFAMTSCNECHGFDLRGSWQYGMTTPDLAIVAAYSLDDFRRLLREGIAIGNRDNLRLMSVVARGRFAELSDEEITDLYAFLSSLAHEPVPANVSWRPDP